MIDSVYLELFRGMVFVSVFSVKIRRELKEKMEKYRDRVNWAEEVRRFIEARIRELEAEENYKRILRAHWSVPRSFSARSVREDRDSN
jgi:chaperonin cofactor prefoldin